MSESIMLIVAVALLAASLAAFSLLLHLFFPLRLARIQEQLETSPRRALGVGLVNAVFLLGMALALLSLAERGVARVLLAPLGLLLLVPLALGVVFGLAALIQWAGLRLAGGQAPWRQSLWGALLLELACGLPFVGWFVALPLLCLLGLGAAILSLFRRASAAEPNLI